MIDLVLSSASEVMLENLFLIRLITQKRDWIFLGEVLKEKELNIDDFQHLGLSSHKVCILQTKWLEYLRQLTQTIGTESRNA